MKNDKRRQCGMTVTELLIVFVILAILGIVALPTYLDFQQRARRTDAKNALEEIAALQERHYVTNMTYTGNLAALGFGSDLSVQGLYTVSVPAANDTGFLAVAVPAPGSRQGRDTECQQFSLDNTGLRAALPDPDGDCW